MFEITEDSGLPENIISVAMFFIAAVLCFVLVAVIIVGARDRRVGLSLAFATFCVGLWTARVGLQMWPGFAVTHFALIEALRIGTFALPAVSN